MSTAEGAPRERGWLRLLPPLAVFLFVPAIPQLRVLVPIEQTLLLLAPILAVGTWVGWRKGGPLWLALLWTAIAVWIASRPMPGSESYVAFARGWALLLTGAFGVTAMFSAARSFLPQALGTLLLTGLLAAAALATTGTSPQRVAATIGAELADRVDLSVAALRARTATPEWQAVEQENPEGAAAVREMVDGVDAQLRALAPIGTKLFPAFLAFEVLCALALAWGVYHRMSRTRLGPPLAPLRDFRFDDQLVWGLVAGLVIVVLPRLAELRVVGLNVLVFVGALYAVRGLGVMSWFLRSPGRWRGPVVMTLVALIPVLWSIPLGLGLGDTWIDWRRRARPSNPGSMQ